MMRICTGLLLVTVAGACATNLSTLNTARTLEPGQWRVSAGAGANAPAGQMARALRLAAQQAARLARAESGEEALPSLDEQREMLATAASLAMYPPGTVFELGLRRGIVNNLDVGLRWSSTSLRLDGRWRLLHRDSGTSLALVAGVERHVFAGFLFNLAGRLHMLSGLFDHVSIDAPSRWDAEAQLIASAALLRFFQPYGALKYRAAAYHLPTVLTVRPPGVEPLVRRDDVDGEAHIIAGTAGVAVGHGAVWLLIELNIAQVISRTVILGRTVDLGGLTLYPAVSLAVRFP